MRFHVELAESKNLENSGSNQIVPFSSLSIREQRIARSGKLRKHMEMNATRTYF